MIRLCSKVSAALGRSLGAKVREELLRVFVADFDEILGGELAVQRFEPVARIFKLLVWVVDREQDTVDTNLILDVLERKRRKVPRGGHPDVLVEVVANRLLHGDGTARLVHCRHEGYDFQKMVSARTPHHGWFLDIDTKDSTHHLRAND